MININYNMYSFIMNALFSVIVFIILNRDIIFDNKYNNINQFSLNQTYPYKSHLVDLTIYRLH